MGQITCSATIPLKSELGYLKIEFEIDVEPMVGVKTFATLRKFFCLNRLLKDVGGAIASSNR
jgi:hypothetical protein